MVYDVFISYKSEEVDLAARLERALKARGLEVWRDEHRLQAGEEFKAEIVEALESSRVGLCLVSDAYLASRWCRDEAALAYRATRMVPVRTSSRLSPARLDGVLAGVHAPALGDRRGFPDETALVEALVHWAEPDAFAPRTSGAKLRDRFGSYLDQLWSRLARVRLLAVHAETNQPDVLLPRIYTRLDVQDAVALPQEEDGEESSLPLREVHRLETGRALRLEAPYARAIEARRVSSGSCGDAREEDQGREPNHSRLEALEAVAGVSRLVLLGDPGAGKSTFARYLSLCLTGELLERPEANLSRLNRSAEEPDPEGAVPLWPHGARLPILIELAGLVRHASFPASAESASATNLLDYAAAEYPGLDRDDLARHLRDTGEAVLIVDGLDETPGALQVRERIRAVLRCFVDAYPAVRVLVTSRPYAYRRDAQWRLDDLGFQTTTLAPFDEPAIAAFVEAWHGLAVERGWLDEELAERREREMKAALEHNPHLRPLAERPLLLTMMADLNLGSAGALRGGRVQLYERATELWVDNWNFQRGREGLGEQYGPDPVAADESAPMTLANRIGLGLDQVREALEDLAARVHAGRGDSSDGPADIERAEVLDALDRRRGAQTTSSTDVSLTADLLEQRSGVLVEVGPGVYRFPHRSFQEYLAACELRRGGPPMLLDRLREDPDLWREPLIMALGKLADQPYVVWPFVDQALGESASPLGHALILAAAAVEYSLAANLPHTYTASLERLAGRLQRGLSEAAASPGDRVQAGRLLAELGAHAGRLLDTRPGVGLRDGVPDISWVDVQAGRFMMGSDDTDELAFPDEKPAHELELSAFRIARYPVTNEQYSRFESAGGYGPGSDARRWWTEAGYEWLQRRGGARLALPARYLHADHPVVGVTWYEAVAFCRWLGERLGHEVRLPTEGEWEKAARGGDLRIYPWGDEFDPDRCNSTEAQISHPSAVGAFPRGASPYSAEDMAGNVEEWCSTQWRDSYQDPLEENLEGEALRVLRGGSFDDYRLAVRCAYRYRHRPEYSLPCIGFRVVAPP